MNDTHRRATALMLAHDSAPGYDPDLRKSKVGGLTTEFTNSGDKPHSEMLPLFQKQSYDQGNRVAGTTFVNGEIQYYEQKENPYSRTLQASSTLSDEGNIHYISSTVKGYPDDFTLISSDEDEQRFAYKGALSSIDALKSFQKAAFALNNHSASKSYDRRGEEVFIAKGQHDYNSDLSF